MVMEKNLNLPRIYTHTRSVHVVSGTVLREKPPDCSEFRFVFNKYSDVKSRFFSLSPRARARVFHYLLATLVGDSDGDEK